MARTSVKKNVIKPVNYLNKDFSDCTTPVICAGDEVGNWHYTSSIDFDATELNDVWYMKSFITENSKYPYQWGETDCRPKNIKGNCKNYHSHSKKIFPITDFYSHGLYFGSFDSYSQCNLAGSQINSFLRNLSINGSMQHSHSSGGNDDKAHRHTINDRYRLGLKYSCINAKGY